jgi:hypothetical protein
MAPSYRMRIFLRAKGILWGPFEVVAAGIGVFLFLYRPLMSDLQRFWEGVPWGGPQRHIREGRKGQVPDPQGQEVLLPCV